MHVGLGVLEKNSRRTCVPTTFSKQGPSSQRALLIRELDIFLVDEASMMEKGLFEIMDVILKDLRCAATYPGFTNRGLADTDVISYDYSHVLPTLPHLAFLTGDDGNRSLILIKLFNKLPQKNHF